MFKKWVIMILFVLLPGSSLAADKWTTQDIVLEIIWEGLHFIDTGTTLGISEDPNKYEMNPIMGRHPNREAIWLYMGLGAILHPLVVNYLPRNYYFEWLDLNIPARTIFQSISIGMSGGCAANNVLKFGFTLHY